MKPCETSRARKLIFVVVLTTVVVAASRPAVAQVPDHYLRGLAAQGRGDDTVALTEFTLAYQQTRLPELLFHIASTHEALQHPPQAIAFYEKFLVAKGRDEGRAKEATLRLQELRKQVAVPQPTEAKEPVDVVEESPPQPIVDDEFTIDRTPQQADRESNAALFPMPKRAPLGRRPGDATPLDAGNVTAQILGGAAVGSLLGLLGFAAGYSSDSVEAAIVLGVGGMTVGSAGVVTAIGNAHHGQTGSFAAAFGGGLLGSVIGGGILAAGDAQGGTIVFALLVPAAFATLGYNLSRKSTPKTAVLNVDANGGLSLGLPIPYMAPNKSGSRELIPSVSLLDMRF